MAKKPKRKINCSICSYFSDRRWNLERHYEIVHNQSPTPSQRLRYWNRPLVQKMPSIPIERRESHKLSVESMFQEIDQFSKLQNRIANSTETFDRVKSLESKVNTLEFQLRELYQHNWIIPISHVQGLSGHVCHLCHTFNFRPILDLGYDMTMQSKHNCHNQIGAFSTPVPPKVKDVDRWAAQILLNYMSYFESIGNRLELLDITKKFTVFNRFEHRDLLLGIPDRYPIITLEENFLANLLGSTINSHQNSVLMSDSQILDFLTKTKSTYGILEIPRNDDLSYYFARFKK